MDSASLKNLIKSDSIALEFANVGNDAACASRCIEIAPKELKETLIGELGIFKLFANPQDGEVFLQTIEEVSKLNPIIRRMFKWMLPGAPGVDFGDPRLRASLTTPMNLGGLGFSEEFVSPLLRAAEIPPEISANEVSAVWSEFRPDGIVG